ncbi:MAG: RecX family transcriptional regulator [Gorillibacterium sp.]|nr:RecX family transcriptional regulator [Gorillibacterium sp.]
MDQPKKPRLITAVERQKRSRVRYNIYLDDEYAFSIHEDLLVKHRLLKGEIIEGDHLEKLMLEDEKHRAYVDAIRFISIRARSIKEVEQKLTSRGYEPPMITIIVQELLEREYLDDQHFAELWAQERMTLQKKGRKWVEIELKQKGVDQQFITAATGKVAEEDECKYALEAAQKKWKQTSGDTFIRKRKLYEFLLRRGFSPSVVSITVKAIDGIPLEEEWELDNQTDFDEM